MEVVLVILIVALIAKDISYIGDPYIMRGAAQALCLFVGGLWLVNHFSVALLKRYWAVIGYLLVLVLATYGTRDPFYVTLQVGSLVAIVIFGIAYFEARNKGRVTRRTNAMLVKTTAIMYGIVAWLSLAAAIWRPSIAYQNVNLGNITGFEARFSGLFSQTGMLGSAAGLLIVLSLFGLRRLFPKLMLVVPGVICLAMTFSRTYWVAVIVATGLTLFSYRRAGRIWILTATIAVFIAIAMVAAFDIQFDITGIGKLVRAESVSNLTGRVDLWERAVKAFELRPYLGYGFTAGAMGLEEETHSRTFGEAPELSSRAVGRTTMHSGYVQSLLDSGAIGTVFYVLVIVLSIRSFYRYDKKRAFPAEFGALIFLSVANLSENAIYAASVFSSILFWILALFALSLEGARDSPGDHKVERSYMSDAVKAKLVSDSRARHFLYPPQSS